MIENVLHLVRGAAEPVSRDPSLLVGSYSVFVVGLPSQISYTNDFISAVFDRNGYRGEGKDFTGITRDDQEKLNYLSYNHYTASYPPMFSGAETRTLGDIGIGNVVYVPRHGHTRDNLRDRYEEMSAKPGAVVYPGYLYWRVETSHRFEHTLQLLTNHSKFSVQQHPTKFEMTFLRGSESVFAMSLLRGNPQITEKQVPKLRAQIEAEIPRFREAVEEFVSTVRKCTGYEAKQAFKAVMQPRNR